MNRQDTATAAAIAAVPPRAPMQHYQGLWESLRATISDGNEQSQRASALQRFLANGFPTQAVEDWKYTRLTPLTRASLTLPAELPKSGNAAIAALLESIAIPDLDAITVVISDGQLDTSQSALQTLPTGLTIRVDPTGIENPPNPQVGHAGVSGDSDRKAFALNDLNRALSAGAVAVEIEAGVTLDRPIRLVFATSESGTIVPLQLVVRAGAGCSAVLIEDYVGVDDGLYWSNVISRYELAESARLTRVIRQSEGAAAYHTADNLAVLQADSRMEQHIADFGGKLVRRDTRVELAGARSEIDLAGFYCPSAKQHVDNHTRIDHAAPNAISREHFRGFAADRGRAVFNGKIVVHPGADGTDSEQASHALLLSRGAEIDSKPELEIYADDVKCAHGATIGQLDETAVFYLRSRGIDEDAARTLLTFAFLDVLVQRIGQASQAEVGEPSALAPLRDALETTLLDRLPGGEQIRALANLGGTDVGGGAR